MRTLFKLIAALALIIGIVTIHLGVAYVLPFPLNKVNIIFSAIVLSLVVFESGISVWTTFFVHLFVEVYAPQPFGIIIFSSTLAILFVFWLYQHIFTNRSWYSAMAMTLVALILYRLFYTVLLTVLFLFEGQVIPFGDVFIIYGWEFLLTTAFTGALYILAQFVSSPLRKDRPKKLVWTHQ